MRERRYRKEEEGKEGKERERTRGEKVDVRRRRDSGCWVGDGWDALERQEIRGIERGES